MLKADGKSLWLIETNVVAITTTGFIDSEGWPSVANQGMRDTFSRFTGVRKILRAELKRQGNHVASLGRWRRKSQMVKNAAVLSGWSIQKPAIEMFELVSFPYRDGWRKQVEADVVKRSCEEISDFVKQHETCVLPPPGWPKDSLKTVVKQREKWEKDIRPILEECLDDRFVLYTPS